MAPLSTAYKTAYKTLVLVALHSGVTLACASTFTDADMAWTAKQPVKQQDTNQAALPPATTTSIENSAPQRPDNGFIQNTDDKTPDQPSAPANKQFGL